MGFLLFLFALTAENLRHPGRADVCPPHGGHLFGQEAGFLTLLSAAFLAFALGNPQLSLTHPFSFPLLRFSDFVRLAGRRAGVAQKLASLAHPGGHAGRYSGTALISINMSNKFWLPSALLNLVVIAYGAVLIPVLFVVVMLYCICPPLLA